MTSSPKAADGPSADSRDGRFRARRERLREVWNASKMRRRAVVTIMTGAALGLAFAAHAQQPARIPRIGYLSPGSASGGFQARDEAFRQGLRDLGYVEGRTIAVEYRFADGRFDRLPELAAELVSLKLDLIVAVVTQASVAAKGATDSIPIVMVAVSDPVGTGLVASLRHPGANVTGTSGMTGEVVGKSLELLREAAPGISRVAVLWNPGNAVFHAQLLREAQAAAAVLGLQLKPFGIQDPDGFDPAFSAISAERVDGLLVMADPGLALHQQRIVAFAERSRLPAMYGIKEFAASGGLMTYAANMTDQFRRAASYVDKIVKGARAAELPVEQPTKFEFVINLKTARALGLNVPATLLGRADEVIE
jgi:putative ABC transport system substrate-binding protein